MVISLVIIGIIFGSVGVAILLAAPYEPSRVAVVILAPGFGDMSKADTIYEGMDEIAGDVSVQFITPDPLPTTEQDARDYLETYASRANYYDLIIAVGEDLSDELQTVATNFPDQKFAMIGGNVNLDNVASATFASQEGAFIGGVVAAFAADDQRDQIEGDNATHDAQIGILAAMDDGEINVLVNGFIQGVEAANDTYDLNVTLADTVYLGSYNDSLAAEGAIYTMFAVDSYSVVFAPVRASYPGVREGMLRAEETFGFGSLRQPLVIAAEGNLDYFGTANPEIPVAPSWITTSVVDRTDMAIYEIVNQTLWDQFPGGELMEYNLANGGSNITGFEYSSTYVPDELEPAINTYIDQIGSGIIVVTRDL
jgi:basic membrane protein A